MTDYISRKAALEAIEKHKEEMAKTGGVSNKGKMFYLMGQDHAIDVLRIVPAADVVPVVRCKDCKYFVDMRHYTGLGWCIEVGDTRSKDWYCADGERRE